MSGRTTETETEWGVWYRSPEGQHVTWADGEEQARRHAGQKPQEGCRITLVRREVTIICQPFEVVGPGTWREPETVTTTL